MSVRLRDVHQVWRLDWSSREGGGQRFDTVAKARRFLDRWRADAVAVSSMRALLARGAEPAQWLTDDEVLRRCAEAISRGRMRAWPVALLRVDDLARGAAEDQPDEALEQGSLHEEKTWIEIELTDMEGNPMPGERYWIKLPDDTVREGALDRLGRAYFGGLDPGECEIRWPDMDEEATVEVERAVTAPAVARASPKDWIEIELTTMDGEPVPRERYWIKLTDGTVREGRLDDQGRAFFNDLDPGECEVRWPDLDEEATVPAEQAASAGEPARERSWVEFELVDMDGAPIANERYKAKGPDGVERIGRTDVMGRARFEGVDPGDFEIVWTDRDEESIEEVAAP